MHSKNEHNERKNNNVETCARGENEGLIIYDPKKFKILENSIPFCLI